MERRQTEIDSLLSQGRMNKPAQRRKEKEKRWRKGMRDGGGEVMRDRVRLRNQAIKENRSEGARWKRRVGSE